MNNNICWICGDIADSGEHIIKKSDLKLLDNNISQQNKMLKSSNGLIEKNGIGSIKSDRFHFKSKICSTCNNERTQADDKAWEKLSLF